MIKEDRQLPEAPIANDEVEPTLDNFSAFDFICTPSSELSLEHRISKEQYKAQREEYARKLIDRNEEFHSVIYPFQTVNFQEMKLDFTQAVEDGEFSAQRVDKVYTLLRMKMAGIKDPHLFMEICLEQPIGFFEYSEDNSKFVKHPFS